jgi:allantoinase
MDVERRITYSSINERPIIRWPNGARLALIVYPNVEHYEYLPPAHPIRNAYPRTPAPDVMSYSGKDFGNRVGIWRIFDVLDKYAIRGTASINLGVLEHYPEVFQACQDRSWDYMGHGLYNTRYMWGVSEQEEAEHIRQCVDLFRKHTGQQLQGWLSPALSHTLLTPDLVAEAGIRYLCDMVHDDQPCPIKVRKGSLISVPYSVDLNDAVAYRQGYESEDFARMVMDICDVLWKEGRQSGRVMGIAMHPYNLGQAHRIRHFDAALKYIMSHDDVWATTGAEVADWYYRNNTSSLTSNLLED